MVNVMEESVAVEGRQEERDKDDARHVDCSQLGRMSLAGMLYQVLVGQREAESVHG